jgi:hypothetical protein
MERGNPFMGASRLANLVLRHTLDVAAAGGLVGRDRCSERELLGRLHARDLGVHVSFVPTSGQDPGLNASEYTLEVKGKTLELSGRTGGTYTSQGVKWQLQRDGAYHATKVMESESNVAPDNDYMSVQPQVYNHEPTSHDILRDPLLRMSGTWGNVASRLSFGVPNGFVQTKVMAPF